MHLIARIERYRDANMVASGPEGPRYVAAGLVEGYRGANIDLHRRSRVQDEHIKMALGATVTAAALGFYRADTFDPLQMHMPVFWAQGQPAAGRVRRAMVCALLKQQVAHVTVTYALMLGALVLLAQAHPVAAWRLLIPEDGQSQAYTMVCLEGFVGLPIYAGVLACEAGAAAARRVMHR